MRHSIVKHHDAFREAQSSEFPRIIACLSRSPFGPPLADAVINAKGRVAAARFAFTQSIMAKHAENVMVMIPPQDAAFVAHFSTRLDGRLASLFRSRGEQIDRIVVLVQ